MRAKIERFLSSLENQINVCLLGTSVADGQGNRDVSLHNGWWCPQNTESAKKHKLPLVLKPGKPADARYESGVVCLKWAC